MARSPKPVTETTATPDDQVNVPTDTTAQVDTEVTGTGDIEASGAGGAETASSTMITVICHAEGGRRRLGRRWDKGETVVAEGDLSEMDLQVLRADPRFTVKV